MHNTGRVPTSKTLPTKSNTIITIIIINISSFVISIKIDDPF